MKYLNLYEDFDWDEDDFDEDTHTNNYGRRFKYSYLEEIFGPLKFGTPWNRQ